MNIKTRAYFGKNDMTRKALHFTSTSSMALLIAAMGTFFTGCDTFSSKTPLSGVRETVIILDAQTKPDAKVAGETIHLPAPRSLSNWPQPSGDLRNSLPVLALSKDPQLLWKASIGEGSSETHKLLSSPVFQHGTLFTMDANGLVSAICAKDGRTIWQVSTTPADTNSNALGGGVACDQDMVYAATSFTEVIALNQKDGTEKWRVSVNNPCRVAPVIHSGKVFVTTVANEMYALDAKTGAILWTHTGMGELTGMLGTATPAIVGDFIITPYTSGEVFSLRTENGYPAWSDTLSTVLSVDAISSIPHIRALPVVCGDNVYLVSHGGRLVCLDLNTGIRKWQREFSGINTPAVVGDYLFMITTPNELIAFKRHTGEVNWVVNLPKSDDKSYVVWTGPRAVEGRLVICGSNGDILFMDPQNGALLHKLNISDSFVQSPIIVDETMYLVGESGTLYAWR